jgi:AcrR family transcriptional regulator
MPSKKKRVHRRTATTQHVASRRRGSSAASGVRTSATGGKPRQPKPASERILEVASLLFAERGFAAVTTRQIATGANVKFPVMYRHFQNKRTLYLTAFGSALARADAKYIALLQQPGAPEARLFAFVSGLYDDLLNDPCISKLMQREILDQDDSGVAKLTKDYFVGPYMMVKDLCAQLTSDESAEWVAMLVYIATMGFSQFRPIGQAMAPTRARWKDSAAVAQLILALVLPGIDWKRVSAERAAQIA